MRGTKTYELEHGPRVGAEGYGTCSERLFYQPYTCVVVIFLANDIGGKRGRWGRSLFVTNCTERCHWWCALPVGTTLGAQNYRLSGACFTNTPLPPQPMVPVALPSALQGNFELPVEVDKMPVDENESNGEKVVRPGIPGSGNSL